MCIRLRSVAEQFYHHHQMKFISQSFLLSGLLALSSNAAITAGDIMIVGYRADATDAISFVTWTTINAGEQLFFTDSGFFDDGTLRDSENIMSWTAPGGGILAGTVVTFSDNSPNATASVGTASGSLSGLAAGGDQVFVGSSAFPSANDTAKPGSTYSGTLFYGFDFNGTAGWDSDASDSNTSALPSALNSVGLNMSVAHIDNGQYTGAKTGLTVAQYKTAILNPSNWTFNDDGAAFGSLSNTGFTIVPEPSSTLLGGLGVLALFRRRR